MKIRIFTDGGSRGNPGPSATGVFITDEKGQQLGGFGNRLGVATNNVAEYSAVIQALDWVIENKEKLSIEEVSFFMDSELLMSQINRIYRVKNPTLQILMASIREREKKLEIPLKYSHVRREYNKDADRYVNQALDNLT